jgi:hypothetical protein
MDILRPGLTIALVVEIDMIREKIDVRSSTIYDIAGKEFIIAQPESRLTASRIKSTATLTYLVREKGAYVRYGFSSEIVRFIPDYKLSSSQFVPAIVVVPKSRAKPFNLRFNYRIEPPSSFPLNLSFSGYSSPIINISLGGVLVTTPRETESTFEVGRIEKMTLFTGDENYDIEVIIKRKTLPDDYRGGQKLNFMALQFFNRPKELDSVMWRNLIDLQRELLAKGLEP